MKANGTIVRCSRHENAELFSLALGGFGLFGIILDVDLHVVPNERYRIEQIVVPVDQALAMFEKQIKSNPDVAMVYARLGIVPDHFHMVEIIHSRATHSAVVQQKAARFDDIDREPHAGGQPQHRAGVLWNVGFE